MERLVVIAALLLGTGTFALLGLVGVSATDQIEPVFSNVYYLQDYCNIPTEEELREQKYRHRRSSDHDDDHDFDDIHKVVQYYARKGYRKIKERIKKESKYRQKWKQIFLDPISQPSIVVRLWRPHDEQYLAHHHDLEQAVMNGKKSIQCKLLLRLPANSSNEHLGVKSFANATFGAVVNFLKMNKGLNSYRLRIVTSDPNMTQYWLHGQRLTAAHKYPTLEVDSNPKVHPLQLQKDELKQLAIDASQWLLIELETLKDKFVSSIFASHNASSSNGKHMDGNKTEDNTEFVINLYAKSNPTVEKSAKVSPMVRRDDSSMEATNNSIPLECPPGTFDCAGDGEQCIPNILRCNGEDNCGNRYDELFNCGTLNFYYIFGSDPHQMQYDFSSEGFWFAVRILVLLFLMCLLMYTCSLLCRCCCDRRPYIIDAKSPLVYLRQSGKHGSSASDPLLASGSSTSSGGFGPTAGRMNKMPPPPPAPYNSNYHFVGSHSPPPSYFGNQSDNQKSNVQEYIYVNNNYGQPQGSTTVNTSVRPSRDNVNRSDMIASAPPKSDNYVPEYPYYGGTNK